MTVMNHVVEGWFLGVARRCEGCASIRLRSDNAKRTYATLNLCVCEFEFEQRVLHSPPPLQQTAPVVCFTAGVFRVLSI